MKSDSRRAPKTVRRRVAAATAVTLLAGVLHAAWTFSDVAGSPATAQAAETDPVRATEAEARALASDLGKPVEVAAFRSETRSAFAHPDGSLISREYAQPVRTFRDGAWVDTDATLVKASDGSFTPKSSVVGLRISGGGDGPLASISKAGRTLSLSWPGKLPEPDVAGDTATYAEVLPGVDLVVHAAADGFSHSLVIKTAEAATQDELKRIEMPMVTGGLDMTETAEGGIIAVDESAGGAVFEAPAPRMWDAGVTKTASAKAAANAEALSAAPAGTSQIADVEVELSEDVLTLVPDQALLTGADTTYPVVIDPVLKSASRTAWAMIASGYPNEEYWKFDGSKHEGVGYCPIADGTCNDVNVKRVLYRMSTSGLLGKNKQIVSAAFHVTLYHAYDSTARPVRLYRIGDFTSATNWSNRPGSLGLLDTQSPKNPTRSCTTTNQNTEFDATTAVSDAVGANQSTVSLLLRADDETEYRQWKRFCDNAYLEVKINTIPDVPLQSKMTSSPGGACVFGSTRKYASREPTLSVVATDPDDTSLTRAEVKVEFLVFWTKDGIYKEIPPYTTRWNYSGKAFTYSIPAGAIPENIPIGWIARVGDRKDSKTDDVASWSDWSWSGDQTRCEFVLDKTKPLPPDVFSADYPSTEDTTADGVGVYGKFTFSSASTDVVSYRYALNKDAAQGTLVNPAAKGGAVSVNLMPASEGPNWVSVHSIDASGSTSSDAVYPFTVTAGRTTTGAWRLADGPGTSQAADSATTAHPAAAGTGVTFGAEGPGAYTAATLNGGDGAYLTPEATGLVDTGSGFSVTAWVRLTDTASDHVAVSVDGSGEPGFTLGYSAETRTWAFATPVTDIQSLGAWRVTGPAPVVGQWAHLAGVYDQVAATMTLYVNGNTYAAAARPSPWRAYGSVQIGRALTKSGYTAHWNGGLADVRVFDRIIVPTEIAALFKNQPKRRAYWPLSTATGGVSPEAAGGTGLTLTGGSSIYTVVDELMDDPALVGSGHLVLDGSTGYGSIAGPVTATTDSFTMTARVRLASASPTSSMTVFAATGANNNLIRVRYDAPSGQWQLAVAGTDTAQPQTTMVFDTDTAVAAEADGQLLAVVYDSFDREIRLYVDGVLAATGRRPVASMWAATGFQLGRGRSGTGYGEYLAGAVDDVRIYSGIADQNLIQRLSIREENTAL
ncbi:LamG domain-containing protein [Actinoplanes derwentensis]|uniref:Concanavalin A-like lectin/glucanases superfamily protein n=1 Tax=Actinoplanes derwentensis TaxID=113562 RepID=A0A1H2DD93_9ACTN|nr:LamG domain-containing protein [Actinoplanes derwentensis]GID89648.1 hypothetical protein Ade03nite_85720 [Actinoplanes derwentensis]SDT80700.1 Concanavalin A-like lectin/glucanases superfamily protein [Actinoplanes derwentensis]